MIDNHPSSFRILLIEDDPFKAKRVCGFLTREFAADTIEVERSVSAGLKRMIQAPRPNAIVLDMSLSTFDVGPRETGGRPQNFGGITVLEHMVRRSIEIPVAIVTQFETFPKDGKEVGLSDIQKELTQRFPAIFRDLAYYNSRETDWEKTLGGFINSLRDKAV